MNQTKPMPKLAAALAFLASLLLIVSLLFTALQLVMHDETWFAARYEAYGTAGEIGIPTKDITAALMQLIDYMEGDVASIDLTVMENGIPVSMYNERETLHMIDVRELYQALAQRTRFLACLRQRCSSSARARCCRKGRACAHFPKDTSAQAFSSAQLWRRWAFG